jgi:hypothetical protein
MAHNKFVNGINGVLRVGDCVVSTHDARAEQYLVGTINKIDKRGGIWVDFSDANYSPFRFGEIEAEFDSYFDDKLHISERGLNNSLVWPKFLINAKAFSKNEMDEILQSKEQAAFHCNRIISKILTEKEALRESLRTEIKFYSPVSCEFHSEHDGNKVMLTQEEAVQYENKLSDVASDIIHMSEMDRGFMTHFDGPDSIDKKVESIFFTMEAYESKLWAVFTLKALKPLTDEELEFMREELTGHYTYAVEEYFSETKIAVEGGEIHIQIWKSGDDFFIETQEQLNRRLGLGLTDTTPDVTQTPLHKTANVSEKPSVADAIRRHTQETQERPNAPKNLPNRKKSEQESKGE